MAKKIVKKVEEKKVELSSIKLIEFIKNFTPYIKGEVAGFEKDLAEKLIDRGVAINHNK